MFVLCVWIMCLGICLWLNVVSFLIRCEFCSKIGFYGFVVCEFWLLFMGVLFWCVSVLVFMFKVSILVVMLFRINLVNVDFIEVFIVVFLYEGWYEV